MPAAVRDPELIEAALALSDNRLAVAERLLRDRLKRQPEDVLAMRMLAELGGRLGRYRDSEALLRRALELAPDFREARFNLATVLHRRTRSEEALAEVDSLLALDPANPGYRNLRAAAIARIGDFEGAITIYEALLADYPRQPKGWMSYGHALKTVGRLPDAIAAYREAIAQQPSLGEVWWSLANLKTVRFDGGDIAAMEAALAEPGPDVTDRLHLHFALGKAQEDRAAAEASFTHYAEANRLRAQQLGYDPEVTSQAVARATALFTPAFFAERAEWGYPAADPIFILGMPRSGSTLVEQILASHPRVEGTMELPDMPALAWQVGERDGSRRETLYPEVLASLSADQVHDLGRQYLDRTRIHRGTERPHFIDKLPNNWLHVGLIRLILPNATIIDARRGAMACCVSNFTQHFARGQGFAYGLEVMARYYRDYVALMAHMDAAQPGMTHRVSYESMVGDTEAQVRALLDHCALAFDPACLSFWNTERAIRTPSSEQVRQPIYRAGLEHWRMFDPWLDPLRAALGDLAVADSSR